VLGLENKRIQFTPDLMPSDIVGSEVLEESTAGRRSFRFVNGPIFTQLLMADEINRASPKTQSALLQAMQEHHVTVAGTRHDVPRPFHVLATENPLEQEGTYPLPEAQLDRFLLQIDVSYPDAAAERRMLFATTGVEERQLKTILSADELMVAQRLVRQLPVGDQVVDAILKLVRSARPGTGIDQELDDMIAWGPGPRASQALMLAVRAKAMIEGRLAPSVDDVIELAEPVLKHRMALTFAARAEGIDMSDMVARLVEPLGRSKLGRAAGQNASAVFGRGSRGPSIGVAHACAADRIAACRPYRRPRHAWPSPCRPRRDLLAVPPFRSERRPVGH
jgi:MoxR-like ATPase